MPPPSRLRPALEAQVAAGAPGAFASCACDYDAVLVGTHNACHVDRWPLVTALGQTLRGLSPTDHPTGNTPTSRPVLPPPQGSK